MSHFVLQTELKPAGDQPEAIKQLVGGLNSGLNNQVLLGVTGSGKTFTIASVIAQVQKPTLVIAHNKTLAAQLTSEYRRFFPQAAVEYFVSYYDYYQPEAYMPNTDTYIEKEAQINDEIDRLRHAATQAVLTRKDTIIIASVSCIYGLGSAVEYQEAALSITKGQTISKDEIVTRLIQLQYERNDLDVQRGRFRSRGGVVEIMPAQSAELIHLQLDGNVIEEITLYNAINRQVIRSPRTTMIYPARHFVPDPDKQANALSSIRQELEVRLKELRQSSKITEAERLERRTKYDIEMIEQVGYCTGIENYSRHFDGRSPGQPPTSLLDYFPKDFLLIIDESHVTVPQLSGMYNGDRARKEMLINYGFRLPSALDNRPLKFDEFTKRMPQTIYTSATPGTYELQNNQRVVEQVIRPTGLTDPELVIRPTKDQIADLQKRLEEVINKQDRALITTLTKRMAEDLTEYLQEKGQRVRYLHSDVATLERVEILRDLRKGRFDVLVGVNLLREGLDLPEVSLVAILDADKEGFLRSETSLIQTIGRAARHVQGKVVLYADKLTGSLDRAIKETERRRQRQMTYNLQHHITPQSIHKEVSSLVEEELSESVGLDKIETEIAKGNLDILIKRKQKEMKQAAQELQFELAAILRDEIITLSKMARQNNAENRHRDKIIE